MRDLNRIVSKKKRGNPAFFLYIVKDCDTMKDKYDIKGRLNMSKRKELAKTYEPREVEDRI